MEKENPNVDSVHEKRLTRCGEEVLEDLVTKEVYEFLRDSEIFTPFKLFVYLVHAVFFL